MSIKLTKIAIIIFWLIWAVFNYLTITIDLPTNHLDGAYQTASGLYRLEQGQFPSRDFYPYLGIFSLYSLYPVFKLFGANLASSNFAAYFVTALAIVLAISFIWQMLWKPKSFLNALVAACLLFYLNTVINNAIGMYFPPEMQGFSLGNSLRFLRSFAPYCTALLFYFCVLKISANYLKYLTAGIITGLALLWSNDYAIPSAFLFALFMLCYAKYKQALNLKNSLIYALSTIISWLVLLSLATAGHPFEILHYNFFAVAQDQWWYFAPYSENTRIFTLKQLLLLSIKAENYAALIVILLLACWAWKTKSLELSLLLWLGIVLFSGGILSSVGGHYALFYFYPLCYWAVMSVVIAGLRFIWLKFKALLIKFNHLAAITALIFVCAQMSFAVQQYKLSINNAIQDKNRFFVSELGGYLNKSWLSYIELARKTPPHLVVAEEYWGLWSALRQSFFTWPVDSVIHALGNTRDIAQAQLQNADIIISTRLIASRDWQPWSISQNYWFYENLFNHWSVVALSPTTLVWQKNKLVLPSVIINCQPELSPQGTVLKLNVPKAAYYEISLHYNMLSSSRSLFMIQNNISFAWDAAGYISLNPNKTDIKFPAYFKVAGENNLQTKIIGNSDSHLKISSCHAQLIDVHNTDVLPLSAN